MWYDYDDGKFEEEVPCFAVKTDIIANDYDYFNLPGKAIKSACHVVMTQKSKDYKLEFFLGSTNLSIKADVEDTIGIKSITLLIPSACMTHSLGEGILLLPVKGLKRLFMQKGSNVILLPIW